MHDDQNYDATLYYDTSSNNNYKANTSKSQIFNKGELIKLKTIIFKVTKVNRNTITLWISEVINNHLTLFKIDDVLEVEFDNFKVIDVFPKGIKLKLIGK